MVDGKLNSEEKILFELLIMSLSLQRRFHGDKRDVAVAHV